MAYGPPTISLQRSRWNAVPGHPAIRLRSQWGAQRSYADEREIIYPATRAFIHISVTNPGNYRGNDAHAQAIERIGISRFPNTGISYNFGIMPNGQLYEFQPVGRRGAHTVNDEERYTCTKHGSDCPGYKASLTTPSPHAWNLNYNARSFVFCAMESTPVTTAVVEMFALAIYTAYKAGFITKDAALHIHGHRCVSAKSCPGYKIWQLMKNIQARISKLISSGGVEDDMFTDADRALLQRLNQVITSNSDEKIDRPDTDTGTAGMRFALQEAWEDTHELTEKVGWISPGAAKHAIEIGWADPTDPTKAKPVQTRYLIELAWATLDQLARGTLPVIKTLVDGMAQILGESAANHHTMEEWRAMLNEALDQAMEENVLRIEFVHDPAIEPTSPTQ
jgi:hypothetical protein